MGQLCYLKGLFLSEYNFDNIGLPLDNKDKSHGMEGRACTCVS